MQLKENERIDELQYKNLKIIQNEDGFCFGIDSVLLSDFAKDIKNNSVGVDLGTGTGIISILVSAKTKLEKIIGVEIQEDVADMANRSVILNNIQDKIEILNLDIKDIIQNKSNNKENINKLIENKLQREKFDFVVTNPPYKKLDTGKVNANENKYISRHELTANLEEFLNVSKYLLKDKGAFYMVHRPDRLVDIIENADKEELKVYYKCIIAIKKFKDKGLN